MGYRPAKDLYLSVYGGGGTVAAVQIASAGDVIVFGPSENYVDRSNVTFLNGV